MKKLNLKMMPVAALVPYEGNAKIHTPEQIESLAETLKRYGFDQPIVIDEENVILKGHGRRLGAIRAGIEEVPVFVRAGLSESEKREIRIADNAVAITGWDEAALRAELSWLQGHGGDLAATGLAEAYMHALLPPVVVDMPEAAPTASPAPSDGPQTVDRKDVIQGFLDNNVRYMQLMYEEKAFDEVCGRMTKLADKFGLENNSKLVAFLVAKAYADEFPEGDGAGH